MICSMALCAMIAKYHAQICALVMVAICAANALVSLAIGVLKGATLGKGPDLV